MSVRNADGTSPFSPHDSKSDDTPKVPIACKSLADALLGEGFTGKKSEEEMPTRRF